MSHGCDAPGSGSEHGKPNAILLQWYFLVMCTRPSTLLCVDKNWIASEQWERRLILGPFSNECLPVTALKLTFPFINSRMVGLEQAPSSSNVSTVRVCAILLGKPSRRKVHLSLKWCSTQGWPQNLGPQHQKGCLLWTKAYLRTLHS